MTINNGVVGMPLENIQIEVNFADKNRQTVRASSDPNDLSARFFIRLQDGNSIPATIPGSSSASIKWLIIPAPGAGGQDLRGELYYVGAKLSYRAAGQDNEVVVDPDTILVKPMPALTLDYFLPNEVYGDDPFTENFVEPPIPFSLGVRVKNSGLGPANKLKIESAQPKIVENKQGLQVSFKIQGCEVNGGAAQSTLLADFGNIQPNRSGVARWIMTSTLSGRFVEFTAYYTHADELGGQLTSLMTGQPKTHFLVHDVLVDLPGRDSVRDFLAKDGDFYRVYESENADTLVTDQSASSSIGGDQGNYKVHTQPFGGFLLIKLPDPMSGRQLLGSVRRGDGRQIHPANAWLSQTWLSGSLKWNYFLNIFDVNNAAGADYVAQYKDASPLTNRPPRVDPISNWAIGPGEYLSFTVTSTDPDGDRLAYRLEGDKPAGAELTAAGAFTWRPTQAQAPSTNRFTITVTDNGMPSLSDSRSFIVKVAVPSTNHPPLVLLSTNRLDYAEKSGTLVLDALAQIQDADTPILNGGRLTAAIIEGASAQDALLLTNTTGLATNVTVSSDLQVRYGLDAVGVLTAVNQGTNWLTVDFNAKATQEAVQAVLRAVAFNNAAIRGQPDGRLVEFVLSDGMNGVSAPVDLEIDITPYNRPPVAANDEAATTSDAPIPLLISRLIGNDYDADGDPLAFTLLGGVTEQRGTVEIYGSTVLYLPDPQLVGTDSFSYRITDPYGAFAEATVFITVRASQSASPSIVSVKPAGNGTVEVKMVGIPNRVYTVQWSFDLLYWEKLQSVTAQANGEILFKDQPVDQSRRFYRITYP